MIEVIKDFLKGCIIGIFLCSVVVGALAIAATIGSRIGGPAGLATGFAILISVMTGIVCSTLNYKIRNP